jgi:drug/metabolite transporter (DMT)-like permease
MEHRSPRFKQVASTGMLLLTALIWGMCFVAQRSGMEHIGPFAFNGVRYLLGMFSLLVVLGIVLLFAGPREQLNRSARDKELALETAITGELIAPSLFARLKSPSSERARGLGFILLAGLICGVALYVASNLQQVGMVTVTASKAAFITTLYIVLVPILGLALRQRTRWNTWVSVAIAVVGLYLLCINENFSLEPGDTIVLVSALFWAVHILAVGHFAPHLHIVQLLQLCVVQFGVAGLLSLGTAPFVDALLVSEPLSLEALLLVAPELLYAGILSTAGAFTLAAVGQKYAKPAPAAVVMSLESAFGLLGGVVLLGETLVTREWVGCALMFTAVMLTQLDFSALRKSP